MRRYVLTGLATALILVLPLVAGEPPSEPDPPVTFAEAAPEAAILSRHDSMFPMPFQHLFSQYGVSGCTA